MGEGGREWVCVFVWSVWWVREAERCPGCLVVAIELLSYVQCFSDPMDCSPTGSSIHRISQARILEQVTISFSRGIFPTQRSNLCLLHWQVDSLLLSYQGIPDQVVWREVNKNLELPSILVDVSHFWMGRGLDGADMKPKKLIKASGGPVQVGEAWGSEDRGGWL